MNTPHMTDSDMSHRQILPVHRAEDLSGARAAVIDSVMKAGIDDDRAAKLAIAVSEIATNSLLHGDGSARVEVMTTADWFMVEVTDRGPGFAADREVRLPDSGEDRGRGLWIAKQLCDRVAIDSGASGTCIALSMRRAPSRKDDPRGT